MYCCKLHLHTQWSINDLVDCCKEQAIGLGIVENYGNFLESLTLKCKNDDSAYIAWDSCPDGKHICSEISGKQGELNKVVINEHSNDQITVPFLSFEMQPCKTKKEVKV